MAFCKPLVSCLLGSPFGGAGTAAAVTERASSRDAGAVRRLRGQNLALLPSFREATFSVRYRPGKAWPLAPVSLAFSHALRAHKVKGKVETFL